MINEKIEYVEYKFKNRSDAIKAQRYFMKQNQITNLWTMI